MRKTLLTSLAVAIVLLISRDSTGATPTATRGENRFGSQFWSHWGDGKAELSGYDLVIPRYGQLRRGTAVAIFVTEPFSNSMRVKAEGGKRSDSDVFQVLKMNLVRDFPTGIYDYNLMTSVFVALQPIGGVQPGQPAKISFSSQEWCGNVYQQLIFRPTGIDHQIHSYFDGEADQQQRHRWHGDGGSEDVLFLWARGLAAPFISAGETRRVPLLGSLMFSRLAHRQVEWRNANLSVSSERQSLSVPAGSFEVEVRTAAIDGDRTWTFFVERSAPHRIVKWTVSDGEQGELLGSDRLVYWQMNSHQFDRAVEKLGLTPRGPRMP